MAKVLAIGFNEKEVEMLERSLAQIGVEVFCVPEKYLTTSVEEIFSKIRPAEGPCNWHERKFVLMGDVNNETIKLIIDTVKILGFGRVIFAAPTEVSMKWSLKELLEELIEEDEYFRALSWAKKNVKNGPFLDFNL